jgi:hypothetical protein
MTFEELDAEVKTLLANCEKAITEDGLNPHSKEYVEKIIQLSKDFLKDESDFKEVEVE